MPYAFVDIEVMQPLPPVTLGADETGLAVLVRRKGRPVGFWMEAVAGGSRLDEHELAGRISARVGTRLVQEAIRDELPALPEPPHFPSLTVAVCTKDRPERLARCLRSILDVDVPEGVAFPEVLVVDNAPSDGRTREVVAAYAGVRYAVEPRPGLDFARNRALRGATGDFLAYLDDDVVVDRGWLGGLVEAHAANPDAAAFTGLVLPFALETPAQILFESNGGFRRGFDKLRFHGQTRPGVSLYPVGAGEFGAGANMAFRRDVVLDLGGFDDALDTGGPLPGGGDLDIFYRVVHAGYPLVYEPAYLVFHEHRRELDALRRQYESWGRGFMAFLEKVELTDPEQQGKVEAMRRWWFDHFKRQFAKSVLGRHPLPPGMVLAEIRGGLRGRRGEYDRSLQRTEAIRQQFPAERDLGVPVVEEDGHA